MIQDLKKKMSKKNIFAFIVFSAIIIVFVFFGFQMGGPGMVGYAARVNNETISLRDLQMASERLAQFYSSFLGGQQLNNEMFQTQIRSTALNQLIQREVLLQSVKAQGMKSSDVEVAEYIRSIPQFQKDGVFQRSVYQTFLDGQGYTSSRFEAQIQEDMILNRFQDLAQKSFIPFSSETEKVKALRESLISFDYVNLKSINFDKVVQVSDAQISEFLANKDNQLKVQLEFDNQKEVLKDKTLESVQTDLARKILKDEKIESILSEFEAAVQSPAQIEELVKKYALSWKKTTAVSLDSDTVPEIGISDTLSLQIPNLTTKGQLVPDVIRTSQGDFLVKLNTKESKKLNTAEIENVSSQLQTQRVGDMINKLTDELSKKYKIVRNESLFPQPKQ